MNKIEFKKVLELFDINAKFNEKEETYLWNGLLISFNNIYSTAIIEGIIPYEIAKSIYEKYPSSEYGIRAGGVDICDDPLNQLVDNKYKSEIQEHINQHLPSKEFLSKCKKSKDNLKKRSVKNKYIDMYHIDTKEGLVILLNEMLEYYLNAANIQRPETSKTDNLIVIINKKMLECIDPNISIYEWMQTSDGTYDDFNQRVTQDYLTTIGRLFRTALEDFESAINPFTNKTLKEIDLDEPEIYLKKVFIDLIPLSEMNGKFREHSYRLIITDKNTRSHTQHIRDQYGFSNKVRFEFDEQYFYQFMHYYSFDGESIGIEYLGPKSEGRREKIIYNISKGIVEIDGNFHRITPNEFCSIYEEIIKATNFAREVTIENMKKEGNKKLIRK